MNLKEMLEEKQYDKIWQSYCGFLDLSIESYMEIQNRLMEEQIDLWCKSPLGKGILKGKSPKTIDDFRNMVPLTTYDDYADVLLQKRADLLPGNPIIWIQTTWEGGKHPIKVAPYTRSMLDVYRQNATACLLLSTSTEKGKFDVEHTDRFLYGLAPLPYVTGLLPLTLSEEIDLQFLPKVKDAVGMTFSERNKLGFKLAMKSGVEYFFGLGSVVYAISKSLSQMSAGSSSGLKSLLKCHPKMIFRILKARHITKKEKRPLMPKDLFKLKGFMIAGTDSSCYKDELEKLWGIRPMELFGGTEPSLMGTETWTRKGVYFFPNTCFYEFLHEGDMLKLKNNPAYQPKTYLMNEVIPGEKYELVLTLLKGGAFARYRVGDIFRCVGLTNQEDETKIPRFEYIDRVPTIIDIAGFTRISENGIKDAIQLSKLPVIGWTAFKEFNEENKPFMHLYIEIDKEKFVESAVNTEIVKNILSTYFKYIDQDYRDLKKILGMDPLKVTLLRCGTFETFEKLNHRPIAKMNPHSSELRELINFQSIDLTYRG
ncbi:MAG: GH3 auxin-responsive promoter family protein [Firmicutes bacterium]|nr:GH3 auxin-responsive promoter family protein [Bacillota bacterium]